MSDKQSYSLYTINKESCDNGITPSFYTVEVKQEGLRDDSMLGECEPHTTLTISGIERHGKNSMSNMCAFATLYTCLLVPVFILGLIRIWFI